MIEHTLAILIWLKAIGLVVMAAFIYNRWKHWLDIPQLESWFVARLKPEQGKEGKGEVDRTLGHYLSAPMRVLSRSFLAAWLFWALFYWLMVVEGITHNKWSALEDVLANATTYMLILFYFKLTSPKHRNVAGQAFANVLKVGWFFVLAALCTYEILVANRVHVLGRDIEEIDSSFKVITGLIQGLALCLVIGRLEAATIRDHLEVQDKLSGGGSHDLKSYRRLLVIGYSYAAIQPLYPAFAHTESWLLVGLVVAAVIGKFALFRLVDLLFTRIPDRGISPMETYLYETERFTVEEISHFERDFLHKHFDHIHRKQRLHKERAKQDHYPLHDHEKHRPPYLGVDHGYLNDFKLLHLGLFGKREFEGGIWVKNVLPSSDAFNKGLRMGDYITHIDGQPIGRANRLSTLLEGKWAGDDVLVKWQSPSNLGLQKNTPPTYALREEYIELGKEVENSSKESDGLKLDCEFLYHDTDRGAVCKWNSADTIFSVASIEIDGRLFQTPDVHMLRSVLKQFNPDMWPFKVYDSKGKLIDLPSRVHDRHLNP